MDSPDKKKKRTFFTLILRYFLSNREKKKKNHFLPNQTVIPRLHVHTHIFIYIHIYTHTYNPSHSHDHFISHLSCFLQMERHHHLHAIPPTSPAPTTFVQADTNSFRDLVQRLTGLATDSHKLPRLSSKPSLSTAAAADSTAPRRSTFKLQERRHSMRKLEIKLGLICNDSPTRQTHNPDSPTPSPVTPLGSDSLFFHSPSSKSPSSEEEKAIADKGFYFHPSPLNTPRSSQPPELLTLFPLSSPTEKTRDC
ncbi:VQ motif-containing protein 33-like [Carica papaya]|uniref:VQ motif-containing protein 33-like n=1 Tax=Carica papaya TaxID=3649 RepID=UPI000B8CE6E7|nr:VQ motif-containing protein 33-like [Carica papaya]